MFPKVSHLRMNTGEKFLEELIIYHEKSIASHQEQIKLIRTQLNNINKSTYLSAFLQPITNNVKFKTEKANNAFVKMCNDNISAEDITAYEGSYVAKRGAIVYVKTCGYLEDKVLYIHNNHFDDYTSADRQTDIDPKSLYPKNIQSISDLKNVFIKDYKESLRRDCELSASSEPTGGRKIFFIGEMKEFIIIYCFYELTKEGEDWDPTEEKDFSRLDY